MIPLSAINGGQTMKSLSITYSNNILPYIQITHNGLIINKHYARGISNEFLTAVLYSEGYDNVPEWLIEAIKVYCDFALDDKDLTVTFTY